ncbi:unnamed protein product [Kuraishia capsulata CBS 1993]|uniref:Zn(2)-C6 fungal-type domain-containing protein n=1 Tax=Kuraishia capsulata CBS 1993 TaxID=1382522 RepID=W6MJJ6_9ASCO|nr:uncharacterized protein KUCA_T00002124001 [Kuraishia capsulata CBS 1993]CDK26153.1 unnamed protein product [Kuraishia capsulata CBS 1993]
MSKHRADESVSALEYQTAHPELGSEVMPTLLPSEHTQKPLLMAPGGIVAPTGVVIQKKKRAIRACDKCRKKKVKCDGKQPCIHCTVYSYECTYDQPPTRKKAMISHGPQKAPAQHHNSQYNSNNNSGNGGQAMGVSQTWSGTVNPSEDADIIQRLLNRLRVYDEALGKLLPDAKTPDSKLNINALKLLSVLEKVDVKKEDLTLKQVAQMYNASLDSSPGSFVPKNNSNSSSPQDSYSTGIDGSYESNVGREIKIILPPKEIALKLIYTTWENACVLFRFYHRPAFINDLNELYETDPTNYTNKQQRFLPLVYSVMACGALFLKSDQDTLNNTDKNVLVSDAQLSVVEDEGYKYFIAARKLIDITDTRDTYGIQTIVMLIIFLQCSARLSTCYAYIGIALRAALREGLHRQLDYPFNPIDLEIRRRLFWTIYKMDIYVNTMLGLPRSISEEDFDQDMPMELDDENITLEGYRFDLQNGKLSSSGIANAHTTVIVIMKKIVEKLYPVKSTKIDRSSTDLLAHDIVYNLELDLQDWVNALPFELKPGVEPSMRYLKANRLLHLSYLHVKIILYRPFIHYISADYLNRGEGKTNNDLRSIEKAKNCINVARVVVKLAEDMIAKRMLSGSYWFSIYTIFFSVACLVYYVHFAPTVNRHGQYDKEYAEIKKDADAGKKVLDVLKDSSMAARRTYNILNALFDQLNRRTAKANSSAGNVQPPPPQFQTPQQGRNKFEREKMQNNQEAERKKEMNKGLLNDEVDLNVFKAPAPPLKNNEEAIQYGNGVNFIDGVSTGINLSTSISENNNSTSDNANGDDDMNASTFDGTEQTKYVPGMMDQLDMKIFGRFLPPYMLNSTSTAASTNWASPEGESAQEQALDENRDDQFESDPAFYSVKAEPGSSNMDASINQQFRANEVASMNNNLGSLFKDLNPVPSGLSTTTTALQGAEDVDFFNTIPDLSGTKRASASTEAGVGINEKELQGLDEALFRDWQASAGFQ